jgi:hypothetical protein
MNIGSASLTNGLAQLASSMTSENTQTALTTAVMKQIMNAEEIQMQMITKLLESSPSPDPAVGQNINLSA